MEQKITYEEKLDMLNRIEVMRSFMSQNARKRLKTCCGNHDVRHFLSQKGLVDLVVYQDSYIKHNVIVLMATKNSKRRFTDVNQKALLQLVKNCRYLLGKDLLVN